MATLTETQWTEPGHQRLDSVDLLRGAVMVLMVLDHIRDFFSDMSVPPTDLSRVGPALFLTRWVTHFCAPVFAFLAGTGAFLASVRNPARREVGRLLVTRGLWLVVLEQTVELFGLSFRVTPGLFLGLVLWSIGWALVGLGVLVRLGVPSRVVGLIGLAVIAGHNLFGLLPADTGAFRPWLAVFETGGLVGDPTKGPVLFVGYPILPWFGVAAAGFGFGELLGWEARHRRRTVLGLGVTAVALFVALRASNTYGDPSHWKARPTPFLTTLDFINCTKYPPSLLYLLMTLGPALMVLAAADRFKLPDVVRRPLVTLGRVPLFYYLLQWYVIHMLALAVARFRGQPIDWLFPVAPPVSPPPHSQFSLPFVYTMWLVVLVALYVPCRWFAGVKQRRRDLWWLGYL